MRTERCYRFIDDGQSIYDVWASHYEEARTYIYEHYDTVIVGELRFRRIVQEWGEREVPD